MVGCAALAAVRLLRAHREGGDDPAQEHHPSRSREGRVEAMAERDVGGLGHLVSRSW